MRAGLRLIFCGYVLLLFAAGSAWSAETLTWDDLAPPWDDSGNPMNRLNQAQQDAAYNLLWGPNYGEPKNKLNPQESAAYDRLRASGVDPEQLFKDIEKLRDDLDKAEKTLVFDLDKKSIRIAGYVLPLEFEGKLVKSFLLVPSVGACIHVPPPPPNQMIYVKPDKPFESEELYAPVWATGEITVGLGRRSLELVDGSSEVDFGYTMAATKIEPYTGQ